MSDGETPNVLIKIEENTQGHDQEEAELEKGDYSEDIDNKSLKDANHANNSTHDDKNSDLSADEGNETDEPPFAEADFSTSNNSNATESQEISKTPRFDATQFMNLLLSASSTLGKTAELRQRGFKIHFLIPDRAAGHVFLDPSSTDRELEGMCFVCTNEGDEAMMVSLNGFPAIVIGEVATVCEAALPSFSKDNLSAALSHLPALQDSMPKRDYGIIYSFSINTDEIECKVHLLDAVVIPGIYPVIEGDVGRSASRGSMDSLVINPRETPASPYRDSLLDRLKHPFAAPIVKEIKRLLKYLTLATVSVDEKAAVTQTFYEELYVMISRNYAWQDAPHEEIEAAVDFIEKYATSKTYIYTYCDKQSDDATQDAALCDKMRTLLEHITFEDLFSNGRTSPPPTLPSIFQNHEGDVCDLFKVAIGYLAQVNKGESPVEKLDAIHLFIKSAAERLGNEGADLLLPVLVWIVIKVTPPNLISDVRFIQRFRNRNRITGEIAYCLTNMIAVISIIEKLHAEKTHKGDPIYSMVVTESLRLSTPDVTNSVTSVTATKLITIATTSSPSTSSQPTHSITPSRSAEIAASFISTIGFVPRAIGNAVADTFKARSNRLASASVTATQSTTKVEGGGDQPLLPQPVNLAALSSMNPSPAGRVSASLESQGSNLSDLSEAHLKAFRDRVLQTDNVDDLTLKDLSLVLEDYKALLKKNPTQ